MQERLLIRTADDASVSHLNPEAAPRLPRQKRALMADPAHFRIEYAINPHMRSQSGALQSIDPTRARKQWEEVRVAYQECGIGVEVLEGDERFPDLVFAANQAFPYPDPHAERSSGRYCFVPGVMAHEERAGEVPLMADWLTGQGYTKTAIQVEGGSFEAGGDLMWFGDRRILVGGAGPRTSLKALRAAADRIEAPLIVLEMHDPDFYHLDTCLSFLDARTALWVPNAFKTNSQKLLGRLVENLIEVDDLEARRGLACNGHTPDGRRYILNRGNERTVASLMELGYDPIEVDTSEFVKAGGSVFCLKMMMW